MPFTINGVGTSYVGKKNLEKRSGTCEACKKDAELVSYQTRLWFVVLFIPVVPLDRKQIIDQCSRCHRHYVIPLSKWERIHDDTIESARQKLSTNPIDAEAFISLHSSLVATNRRDEVAELERSVENQFNSSLDVQLYLGNWFYKQGKLDRSERCLENVLQLEPNNLEAKYLLGLQVLKRKDFSRARTLLSFLMSKGPYQDPQMLWVLAEAYREAGQLDQALEVFEVMIRDFPKVSAQDRRVRKAVKDLEKSLGRPYSILPKARMKRQLKVALAAVGLVAVVALGGNWYLANNRVIHVINELDIPAEITTTAGRTQVIEPWTHLELKVADGSNQFQVKISPGLTEKVDFFVEQGFLERLSPSLTYIFNVFGVGIIEWEQTTYYETLPKNLQTEEPYRYYLGDRMLKIPNVDYLFEEFPEEIDLPEGTTIKRKTRVSVVQVPAFVALPYLAGDGQTDRRKILDVCETHLKIGEDSELMLGAYLSVGDQSGEFKRCRDFLKQKLADRPIDLPWHRTYQRISQLSGEHLALINEYTAFLAEKPDDPDLLYLRGRLETSAAKSETWFKQALAIDPNHAFALYATAWLEMARANFTAADEACRAACSAVPDQHEFNQLLEDIRWARKDYDNLEQEAVEILKDDPADVGMLEQAMQAEILLGKEIQARNNHDLLLKAKEEEKDDDYGLQAWCQRKLAYLLKDYQTYEQQLEALEDEKLRQKLMWQILLEQGRMNDVDAVIKPAAMTSAFDCLAVAVGWLHNGSKEAAAPWLEQGVALLEKGIDDELEAARILKSTAANTLEELDDLVLIPHFKRVIYALLALQRPQLRREALIRAQKMNFKLEPPHHLIEAVTQTL